MAATTKNKPETEENIEQAQPFESNPNESKNTDNKKDKKSKDKKLKDKDADHRGGRGKLIFIGIVLLLLGAAVAVVVFDAFGVRDKYVYGVLRQIPIVKNVIPAPKEEENPYAGLTNEQLIVQLEGMQIQLDNKDEEIKSLNDKSDSYVKELTRLKEIENYQLDVKKQKDDFDSMIALNDPTAYEKFYASIDPENAERLYKEAVGTIQSDKDLKNYVSTFSAMDESEAAKILEAMIATDMDRVVLILKNINVDSRAAIMGKFTPANGARVTRMLAPQ